VLGVSIVLFVVLLAVLFAVAAVTAGFFDLMKPSFQDARPVGLPDGRVRPGDLDELRFNVVLRGYKMAEVDAILHRMARELAERDAVLAELRGEHTVQRGLPIPPYEPPVFEPAPVYEPLPYDPPPVAPLDAPTEVLAPVVDDAVTEQFLLGDETQGFPVHEAPPLEHSEDE
jgi:DivIVA domain-containing protein